MCSTCLAQASLLWFMGLRQQDIRRLGRRDYMSLFGISASTLQARLQFLREEVCGLSVDGHDSVAAWRCGAFAVICAVLSCHKSASLMAADIAYIAVHAPDACGLFLCYLHGCDRALSPSVKTVWDCEGGPEHEPAAGAAAALAHRHDLHN